MNNAVQSQQAKRLNKKVEEPVNRGEAINKGEADKQESYIQSGATPEGKKKKIA